ncbi:MAG: PSD1 domain-containing protein [Saprospiraceae bacterium]|nr:PSD1 domain-containing protein [Saprospiraceae bacterium]
MSYFRKYKKQNIYNSILYIFLLGLISTIFLNCSTDRTSGQDITYNTHIRPILSDKCFKCHGPDANKRKSGYRLDTEEGAFAALKDYKDKYGIVAGHPEKSDVFLRITSKDPDYLMPPPESNLSLTSDEISLIEKWIKNGAPYQKHWSFIPLKATPIPDVKSTWANNEIDRYIVQKLQENDLQPSEVSYDAALLKRMMHDIIGLPPNLAEQDEFAKTPNAKTYEKLLDKALANPQYGEKMAIFWMDVARYADSHGYQDDGLRTMWPWRDWVIHAFNKNYDYKKFVTWQLAGDLLSDKNKETILATGFNRNHKITQEGGVIDEEYRIEYVTDRTNTFGKGLLAMTFECAKCHDHKYDPISQKDYFSTFAFFDQVDEKGLLGDISLASLADPPYMTITKEDKEGILSFISKLDTGKVDVMIMKDSTGIRKTKLLERGVYDRPGEVVSPGTPESILKYDPKKFEQNRMGLAKWMFDSQNPLTARVFVNFIWQEFFGKGIVKTSGDFGLQGDLPSHPELLDWLAYDFMTHGWDIKRLVKQIAMSSTYKQSSKVSSEHIQKDPENVFLGRGPRLRLSAELLKDHILASSGLLNPVIGGPSVKPYQPKGLWESATSGRGQLASYVEDQGDKRYRRGLYHFIKRTVPPPSMLIFDASNRDQCEVKRSSTNTPLQSLVLMNDYQVLEAARHLAIKTQNEKSSNEVKFEQLFRKIVCRAPKPNEIKKIKDFHQTTVTAMDDKKAKEIVFFGDFKETADIDIKGTAAMMQTVQLLFNLEETSTR